MRRLRATSGNSYSSNWVGTDAYLTSTVEQIGTESDCVVSNNGAGGAQVNYV
jgi:hypothetical protein